jgi:hypothetical protein
VLFSSGRRAVTLHSATERGWCAVCGTNRACGDGWHPNDCAECIAARREAANDMLAELYADSAYRCRWCFDAARHPHLDWCGQCAIPAAARGNYLWKNSR